MSVERRRGMDPRPLNYSLFTRTMVRSSSSSSSKTTTIGKKRQLRHTRRYTHRRYHPRVMAVVIVLVLVKSWLYYVRNQTHHPSPPPPPSREHSIIASLKSHARNVYPSSSRRCVDRWNVRSSSCAPRGNRVTSMPCYSVN